MFLLYNYIGDSMDLNYNDDLEMNLLNTKYYFDGMNPLYCKLIIFLHDTGLYKLKKSEAFDYKYELLAFQKYLESDFEMFKKLLKIAINNGFDEDLSLRYSFSNRYTRTIGEYNQFSVIKFKIIDNKLFAFDMMLSSENQALIKVKTINGYKINDIVQTFRNDGYINEQIGSMIQHKEILTLYGFESKKLVRKI